mgnify:CR=1 FL=1
MMMLMMAGFATPSMGQITVSVKDKPLTEVMPLVEKQGGFRFFYSNTSRISIPRSPCPWRTPASPRLWTRCSPD